MKKEEQIRMLLHPEKYTEEQLGQMLDDTHIPVPDANEALEQFQKAHVVAKPTTTWYKMAASFIGILMLSGIAYATIDRDFGKTTYDVRLNDGTEVDFDAKGTWDKVDCGLSAVPAQLVPTAIADYVKANFAGAMIVKIDKERHGYDIELSNDLELKFNKQGQLIGFDD